MDDELKELNRKSKERGREEAAAVIDSRPWHRTGWRGPPPACAPALVIHDAYCRTIVKIPWRAGTHRAAADTILTLIVKAVNAYKEED